MLSRHQHEDRKHTRVNRSVNAIASDAFREWLREPTGPKADYWQARYDTALDILELMREAPR